MPPRSTIADRILKAGADPSTGDITWLDDGIGALIIKLEELNMLENTLIIIFNDNGMDRGGKNTGYDEGVHVPSLAWGTIVTPGVSQRLANAVDFAPTFLDLAGIPAKNYQHDVDGKSLAPLLSDPDKIIHESVYCEIGHTRTVITEDYLFLSVRHPEEIFTKEVREKRFKDVWSEHNPPEDISPDSPYGHHGSCPGGPPPDQMGYKIVKNGPRPFYYDPDQLYELKKDPLQTNNLVRDDDFLETTLEMKKLLTGYLNNLPGTFGEYKKGYEPVQ
jgi:hypothetical protein